MYATQKLDSGWDCLRCGLPLWKDDKACPMCGGTDRIASDVEED